MMTRILPYARRGHWWLLLGVVLWALAAVPCSAAVTGGPAADCCVGMAGDGGDEPAGAACLHCDGALTAATQPDDRAAAPHVAAVPVAASHGVAWLPRTRPTVVAGASPPPTGPARYLALRVLRL